MEIVVIAGNGTSLVYEPRLAGDQLAAQIATELPDGVADRLRAITTALGTDLAPGDPNDFEHLLGPLDRIASALESLAAWAQIAPEQAGAVGSVIALMRTLHRQGFGLALDVIARHSAASESPALTEYRKFVTWALGLLPPGRDGVIRLFNLCYDGLLASELIAQAPGAGLTLSDQAVGWAELEIELFPGEPKISAWQLRPATSPEYLQGSRSAVLYHLHGSLGWFRAPSGQVFKATLADMRKHPSFYREYAAGSTAMQPAVILTDRKTAGVSREPFFTAYSQLTASIATADALVIAGYAFRDVPLNTALAGALRGRADRLPRVLVLGYAPDALASKAYRHTALAALAPEQNVRSALLDAGRFECWTGGLPDDLSLLTGWPG